MSIPLVPNPIPAFQGPSGGDIANGFLNAFFATRNSMRADDANRRENQMQQMRMEEADYQRGLRPLREESMRLGVDQQRQSLKFGAEDQARQNEQFAQDKLMWPLEQKIKQNQLLTGELAITSANQDIETKNMQMANRLNIMKQLAGGQNFMAGISQDPRAALQDQHPGFTGEASSYGYTGDQDNGYNSLGMKRGEQPWYGQHPTVALHPDKIAQLGVRLPFKNPDGSWNTDHSKVDIEVNGKKTTAIVDERGMYLHPNAKDRVADLTPEAANALGLPSGPNALTQGVTVRKFGSPAAAATGMRPGGLLPIGLMKPEVIKQALDHYDFTTQVANIFPPNTEEGQAARTMLTAQVSNPTMRQLLQQRAVVQQTRELGNATAVKVMSTPVAVTQMFKTQLPQFKDVEVVPVKPGLFDGPNAAGTFDVARKTPNGYVPLTPVEKKAYADAYDNYAKDFKLAPSANIPAQTATQLGKYYNFVAQGEALKSRGITYESASDDERKVLLQAEGAQNAINSLLKLNVNAGNLLNPVQPPAETSQPTNQPTSALQNIIKGAGKKQIPGAGAIEGDAAYNKEAVQKEAVSRAADSISSRIHNEYPDNGKDSIKDNPALRLARNIFKGYTHLGEEGRSGWDKFWDFAQGMPTHPSGRPYSKEELAAIEPALSVALKKTGLKPDETASHDITNEAAMVQWAKQTLDKYGYDTSSSGKAPPAANATNPTSTEIKNKYNSMFDAASGSK